MKTTSSFAYPYLHGIIGEEAGETAAAIFNGELCAILLVGARLRAVILVVQHWRQNQSQTVSPASPVAQKQDTDTKNRHKNSALISTVEDRARPSALSAPNFFRHKNCPQEVTQTRIGGHKRSTFHFRPV